ncbi:polysaccharide deacetylase family protein [Myxococcota bacterium]|nr:polysaccharide deacetylase family protein [Myxococcota bacterium]
MTQALAGAVLAVEIVLSFDDAPLPDSWLLSGNERTDRLIEVLRDKSAPPVVFYANPRDGDGDNLSRLVRYGEAGHFIANHTNDHPDLGAVTAEEFTQSISRAEKLLAPTPNFRKWFRYPYLNEGQDAEQKELLVKKHLKEAGYRSGYVTVETFDWYIDRRISEEIEKGHAIDQAQWKRFHVTMIVESVEFYDNFARELLGRSPVHVILLHENDINALALPDLIDELRRAGHTLVSAEGAFADPIADRKWEEHRFSQRRLMAIANESHYGGQVNSRWIDTEYIDQQLEQDGLLCQGEYFFCSFSPWLCEQLC